MFGRWAAGWVGAALALAGCSTDVDVNAPYREQAVIYGLLDAAQPRQMIRLERAFLNNAEKNVGNIVGVPDSIYYPPEAVSVRLYSVNAQGVASVVDTLQPTVQATKDTGVFYAPNLVAYYGKPGRLLNPNLRYQVRVTNRRTGYEATAATNVLAVLRRQDVVVPLPPENNQNGQPVLSATAPEIRIAYPSRLNAAGVAQGPDTGVSRASIRLTIPVVETLPDGQTNRVDVAWQFLADQPLTGGASQYISARYIPLMQNGVRYYELFETLLRGLDTNKAVQSRTLLPITVEVALGNRLLDRYIQANRSFSAITQTAPFYSNVDNGIGLVASRTVYTFQVGLTDYGTIVRGARYHGLRL